MPSILSSCLILLKLAMAVNDGLHTMLSNIYSVIENVMQDDQNRKENHESVKEANSAPAFQRSLSKSQILKAFNKRRANLAICEQTDVLVSNLTPFQEITITNKDIEGKRKFSVSPEKSPCKRAVIESNSDVESSGETSSPERSPSLTNSQSGTSSLVSSDVEIDSKVQSCKVVDNSSQVEEAKDGKESLEGSPETMESAVGYKNKTRTLKESSTIPTSFASRSSINKSLKLDPYFIKSLQEQIKMTSDNLRRTTANHPNANGLSPRSIWGLTDSDSSTEKGKNVPAEVRSNSAPIFPEDSVSSRTFFEETARLYEDYLHNFYTENDARTDVRTPNNSTKSNSNPTISKSNGTQPAFEDNISSIRKASSDSTFRATVSDEPSINGAFFKKNSQPASSVASHDYCSDRTDSDCTGFGYFSDAKPMSRVSATKHLNTYRVPLSLNKDSWINMEDVDIAMIKNSFQWLNENPEKSDKNDSNKLALSKESSFDWDCDSQSQSTDGGLFSKTNHSSTDDKNVCEASQDSKPNLSSLSDNQSDDLEAVSLARVNIFAKMLQDVGSTEVLNEPAVDEHELTHSSNTHTLKLVNEFSDAERSFLAEFNSKILTSAETKSSSSNNLLDFDIPFEDLDTEEKQLSFLDNITERYLLHCKSKYGSIKGFPSIEHTFFEDFEERKKIMLDTITEAYKHELDSLTRSVGICLDISLVKAGLETNLDDPFLKMEATSRDEDCWKPSAPPKETTTPPKESTAVGELDAFGLPVFVQNKTKSEDTEHVENKNTSFEVKRETSLNEYTGLLEMNKDHSGTFTVGCSRNETGTPIKDEEQNLNTLNLSSESLKDLADAASGDAKPNHCLIKLTNPTSFDKDASSCIIENGIKNKRELVCLHDEKILVAKDWRDLAAEMSKNYEMCISILNKCEDEAGNSNANKESNCNERKESCKGKTGMERPEMNCDGRDDLPRRDNCNEPYLDATKTNGKCHGDNMVHLEERESDRGSNPNIFSVSNKHVESASFKCDNSSSHENKSIANYDKNTLKLKDPPIGEQDGLDSEEINVNVPPMRETNLVVDNKYKETAEIRVSDNKVELCPKSECGSDPIENQSSQTSEAVKLKELLSTTKLALANGEPQNNSSLCKKDLLNKEFLSNNFDREIEFYLKYVESKDRKNDDGVTKDVELVLSSDHSETRQELESMQIGELPTEETCRSPGKSTSMSNIEDLRQREELDSTRIYDNCLINSGTVDATPKDRHLPLEDNESNTNALASESKVRALLYSAENGRLSDSIEVNTDILVAENSLILDEEMKIVD